MTGIHPAVISDMHQIPRESGVYLIRNTVNDRIYVGSAAQLMHRCKRHVRELCRNNHTNKYLQSDWNLYGQKVFVIEILQLTEDKRNVEQAYLDKYFDKQQQCYNIQPVVDTVILDHHTDESKEKIRQAGLGRKHSEATKKLMSERAKGKPKSEAHKAAMSKARTGMPMNLSDERREVMRQKMLGNKFRQGIVGWHHSEETKAKISKNNKRTGKPGVTNKTVYQFDKNYTLIAVYKSFKEAKEAINAPDASSIIRCAQGKMKSSYGYYWSYTDVLVPPTYHHKRPSDPLYQFTLDGQFVAVHANSRSAAKSLNCDKATHISSAAKGTRRMALGYLWSYTPEPRIPVGGKIPKSKVTSVGS